MQRHLTPCSAPQAIRNCLLSAFHSAELFRKRKQNTSSFAKGAPSSRTPALKRDADGKLKPGSPYRNRL